MEELLQLVKKSFSQVPVITEVEISRYERGYADGMFEIGDYLRTPFDITSLKFSGPLSLWWSQATAPRVLGQCTYGLIQCASGDSINIPLLVEVTTVFYFYLKSSTKWEIVFFLVTAEQEAVARKIAREVRQLLAAKHDLIESEHDYDEVSTSIDLIDHFISRWDSISFSEG